MNVERLYEIVSFLRRKDSELSLQTRLTNFNNQLAALVNQPQNQSQQTAVSSSLNEMTVAFDDFDSQIAPPQRALIEEMNGAAFFSASLARNIATRIIENSMTPVVVSTEVSTLTTERQAYLSRLTEVEAGLEALGVKATETSPGEAELGVLVPRNLFDNHLGHLAQELATINRIIRAFLEVTTGSGQEVEVRQISTSDPTFFLGIPVVTLLQIGVATDYLIKKWKEIEEIRKLRAETLKLQIEAALPAYDAKIDAIMKTGIQEIKADLIKTYEGETGRRHELEASLQWALESLAARIERGLTIEIRVLAPPTQNDGEDPTIQAKTYDDLQTVGRSLQSVKFFGDQPIMKLPTPQPPESVSKKTEQPTAKK